MGITERRVRQRNALRREILDAATEMFAEQGFERVSMRKLAERVEYSPTAIYLHFRDKEALFHAVCEEAFGRLIRRLEKQRQKHADDPLGCLKAGLLEYIDFGLKHPDHYMVAFMNRSNVREQPFEGSAGEQAFSFLRRTVADGVAAGVFRPIDVELTSQVLWMSVHGLVSLLVAKEGFPFAPRRALEEELLATLVRGLVR